jgi:oxaloacetate decarboxylase alpha subunit/pyruvate carboxylase subunit B
VLVYALYPVTGLKFLKWKYGKEVAPPDTKSITLEEVRKQDDLVRKAKAGLLVEKTQKPAPAASENLRKFNVFVDGEYFEVGVDPVGGAPTVSFARPMTASMPIPMAVPAAAAPAAPPPAAEPPKAAAVPAAAAAPAPAAGVKGTSLVAPMPGMIVKYLKNVGDKVTEGETLLVLEAMKMENALPAPASGTIQAVNFKSGDSVKKGDVLAVVG